MSIILASGSPRRKELLEMLGVEDLKIIPAKGEESAPEGLAPGELVMTLAAQKGREVKELCSAEDVIIAADTIVWHEGGVYGKPRSAQQAKEMLRSDYGSLADVAFSLGYSNIYDFSRDFKKHTGVPPSKY